MRKTTTTMSATPLPYLSSPSASDVKYPVTSLGSSSSSMCPYGSLFAQQLQQEDHPCETCDGANYEEACFIKESPSTTTTQGANDILQSLTTGDISFGSTDGIKTDGYDDDDGDSSFCGEMNLRLLVIREIRLDKIHPGFVYKISVNQEQHLLAKKDVPEWTVCLEIPFFQEGVIKIDILARETSSSSAHRIDEDFVIIASNTVHHMDFFPASGEPDSASERLPIVWERAPDMAMVLETTLETDISRTVKRGKSSIRCRGALEQVSMLDRRASSKMAALFDESVISATPPLTNVEVVIVKDSYNKALAWLDVVLEMIVERLYFLVPTLPDILADFTPLLQQYLHGIIDLAVRSLDTSTENVSRESYKAIHPHPSRPHQLIHRDTVPFHPLPPSRGRIEKDIAGYVQTLAEQGFMLKHWEVLRDLWLYGLKVSPYMEAYEKQNMELGTGSAVYRFFTLHVMRPAVSAIVAMDSFYENPANAQLLADSWSTYAADPKDKLALGGEFYKRLFSRYPDLGPLFQGVNTTTLSKQVTEILENVMKGFRDMWSVMPTLRRLAAVHTNVCLPSSARVKMDKVMMEVLNDKLGGMARDEEADRRLREIWEKAWTRTAFQDIEFGGLPGRLKSLKDNRRARERNFVNSYRRKTQFQDESEVRLPMNNVEALVAKAHEWIDQVAHELRWDENHTTSRKGEIYNEVINQGTYWHTSEELVHGARMCWRNSSKCIGRIAWKTLMVRDKRRVSDLGEMFVECMEHQRIAAADGSIKSVMTIFRPQAPGERMGTRFWNQQLTRYAAYNMEGGSVMGDKANLELTTAIIAIGWTPPEPRGPFDLLPLVFETSENEIRMFDVPQQFCREVPLEHPAYPAFGELGLKWAAVPSISNFTMNLGGVNFTACPFNGWFMDTEMARNLMEDGRCGRALEIAQSFGIKISDTDPFWKNRTFLELNYAIMHSFRKNGITIIDHHTASQQFMTHDLREKRVGRECPAQWSWIVPPLGGSLTSVFHHEMRHFDKEPRFVYQAEIYKVKHSEHTSIGKAKHQKASPEKRLLVLYGSETGTAEGYAFDTAARLRSLVCHVAPLDEFQPADLTAEDIRAVLVVISTFGVGGMPQGGKTFYEKAQRLSSGALTGVRYSIMALGSSTYPNLCAAGKTMDKLFHDLGAERLCELQLGDEINNQAQSVHNWQDMMYDALGTGSTNLTNNGGTFEAPAGEGIVTYLEENSKEVLEAMNETNNVVRKGFSLCNITTSEELLKPATNKRSTRSIGIDLASNYGLKYETGDHVSILPSNDPAVVASTLSWTGARPDQWFTVTGNSRPPFPVPTTFARAFANELDLSTREPVGSILDLLYKRATKDSDKRDLQRLIKIQDTPDWSKTQAELLRRHTTVFSIMQAFPSARVTAKDLVLTLPLIKPRYYSISSAAEVHPRHLQLTVGVLKVENQREKTTRKGLCSHFLARQTPGQHIRLAVRPSTFRSPPDLTSSPVIMVGAGTGISPMLGFLQARQKALWEGARLAQCLVYFGCRDATEFLHADKMIQWSRQGVITELYVATSREGMKTYVQHLIAQKHLKVWQFLRHPTCHTYVCGNSSMAEMVKAEMMMAVLRCGRMDPAGVVEFFKNMKDEKRFQSDTWGVVLPGATAVETFLAEVEAKE